MAKWYKDNLGMKIVREGPAPANMRFISDSGGNMMLELYNNPPDEVPDYPAMNPLSLHIAFMVDDVKAITKKLIAAEDFLSKKGFILSGLLRSQARDIQAELSHKPVKIIKKWEPGGVWYTFFGKIT